MATTPSAGSERNDGDARDGREIELLFNFSRHPSGWKLFILCVYFPLGVVLAILRLFIGLHIFIVSLFLRQSATGRRILRGMSVLLGVVVLQEGEQRPSRVIVANHVSPFDRIAVSLTRRVVLPTAWEVPEIIQRILGVVNLGLRSGREALIKNAKIYCGSEIGSRQPLLAFPEGAMTNGSVGLLKFNNWPFSLNEPVQPLIIHLLRPGMADVAPTTVGSGLVADTLWLLSVPYTVFKLQWLPEMKMEQDETAEGFTRRVERTMAEAAGLKTTNLTSHDAFEFAKKHLSERSSQTKRPGARKAHPYDHLVATVKEIVPQVPLTAILSDLERTGGSVDTTIANILEGRVTYTPEKITSVYQKMPKVSTNDPSSWRELFDARKRELLESQRRKYLSRKGYSFHQ